MFFNSLPYDPDAPKVEYSNGILTFKGRAIPEDASMTWIPIIDELRQCIRAHDGMIINFRFDYYNTKSSHWLVYLFTIVDTCVSEGKKIELNWFYPEDDETLEGLGENFKDMLKTKLNLIKL